MLEGHISKAFDGDLAALHLRALEMGGLVLDQVREATRAYTDWDGHAAERVLERAAAVSQYEEGSRRDELALVARRQPVSRDLKAIFALGRSVAELERAGAEAHKIARTVLQQGGRPTRTTSADVRHLGQLAASLLRSALEALDRLDRESALAVIARDAELDAEYAAGLRRLISRAMEDPRALEVAIEAAFALKSLERIGDHARNVARQVQTITADADDPEAVRAPAAPPAPANPPASASPDPAG